MSNKKETILSVEGMTCTACVRHVEGALRDLEGVDDVEVKLKDGIARIEHDASGITVQEMIKALEDAGYWARANVQ